MVDPAFLFGQGVAFFLVYGLISRLALLKAATNQRIWIAHFVSASLLYAISSKSTDPATTALVAVIPGLLLWGLFDFARAKRRAMP